MHFKKLLLSSPLVALISGCADSDRTQSNDARMSEAARSVAQEASADVQAATLAIAADQSRLTLRGKVLSAQPNSFRLGFGDEAIAVEMDDWDWYQEGRAIKVGDEVVVTGRVDQDLLEGKKIEASSVFVRNLGVHFYANGADEEDITDIVYVPSPSTFSDASGIVRSVEGREFTIGASSGTVRVDTSAVAAPAKIKVGNRVYAWGELDIDPYEKVELQAKGVVIISQDKTKTAKAPLDTSKPS